MILFHGSPNIITKPIFGYGNPNNDYGLGFYCSESIELAKEWACTTEEGGFANQYEFDMTGLNVMTTHLEHSRPLPSYRRRGARLSGH